MYPMLTASQIAVQEIDWSGFPHRPAWPSRVSDWSELIAGKTILITGAGGSIGSSLALLLMAGPSHNLIFLDRSKDNLDLLYQRYKQRDITLPEVWFIQGDISDQVLLEELFTRHQPHVIFHAAALKHLGPLESDPFAALENNTLGTAELLQIAERFNVEHFVNISTDKAVSPTSVLGVSKRIAELFLLACEQTDVRITSLRLGNVLGSSGSVASIFLRRLQERLPLEITHHDASRYFLTMHEGASFLLQSLALRNSPLLLPKMGAPRKIIELAGFLQRWFDVENHNRPMISIGLRDGEKLCEQITYDFEYLKTTELAQVYEVCGTTLDPELFKYDVIRLRKLVEARRKNGLLELLLKLVPEFHPSSTLVRYLV